MEIEDLRREFGELENLEDCSNEEVFKHLVYVSKKLKEVMLFMKSSDGKRYLEYCDDCGYGVASKDDGWYACDGCGRDFILSE